MTAISRTRTSTRLARLIAGSTLALLGLSATAPAQAHDELVSTVPEQNTVLEDAPESLKLNFSGELTEVEGATQVRVTDSDGQEITQGDPQVKGKTVTQKIKGTGADDETYTVTWRVVSSDGHPIQGSYDLTVGGQATVAQATQHSEHAQAEHSHASSQESAAASSEVTTSTGQEAESNSAVKIGLFALASLVAIGAIVALIAKTRKPGSGSSFKGDQR